MNFFSTYISDSIINALGWTIIHSLWQGLFIGFIVFMILKIRRNSTPQFKYLTGVLALAAILASSFITFLIQYQPIHGIGMQSGLTTMESGWPGQFRLTSGAYGQEMWNEPFQAFMQTISTSFYWMTILWLMGVLILSFRLAGGMILVSRLRSREISPLPAHWEERVEILADKAGIRRALKFFQSTRVRVPTVIGILRPVILIPAGIISLMPVDQLESILAHEIAHIRRYDFLVNIFQSLIEALFFYHPVVWIISENVRHEREKCCDDFAVELCGELSIYARALAGLSELQIRSVVPSVALTGNRNKIFIRVERLLNTKKMKTNASEKIVAGLVILSSALIVTLSTGAGLNSMENQPGASMQFDLMAFEKAKAETPEDRVPALPAKPAISNQPEIPAAPAISSPPEIPAVPAMSSPTEIPAEPSRPDTTHRPELNRMDVKDNVVIREFVNKDGEEQSIKFVIRNGDVEELYVNGDEIPESEFPEYEKEIDRTMSDLEDMDRDLRQARQELGKIDWEEIRRDMEADMKHFRQHDMLEIQKQMEELQKERFDIQLDHEKMQEDIRKAMEEASINTEDMREEMMKAMAEIEMLDQEKIQKLLDEQMLAIENIDFHKIQEDIVQAMKEIEKIDFDEIERTMQESMKNLAMERFNLDKEMEKIDELINEIEKLELEQE